MQKSANFNLTVDDQKMEFKKLKNRMVKKAKMECRIKSNNSKNSNRIKSLEVLSNKI